MTQHNKELRHISVDRFFVGTKTEDIKLDYLGEVCLLEKQNYQLGRLGHECNVFRDMTNDQTCYVDPNGRTFTTYTDHTIHIQNITSYRALIEYGAISDNIAVKDQEFCLSKLKEIQLNDQYQHPSYYTMDAIYGIGLLMRLYAARYQEMSQIQSPFELSSESTKRSQPKIVSFPFEKKKALRRNSHFLS